MFYPTPQVSAFVSGVQSADPSATFRTSFETQVLVVEMAHGGRVLEWGATFSEIEDLWNAYDAGRTRAQMALEQFREVGCKS